MDPVSPVPRFLRSADVLLWVKGILNAQDSLGARRAELCSLCRLACNVDRNRKGEQRLGSCPGGVTMQRLIARFQHQLKPKIKINNIHMDRLCGLVVRVLGYRSGGPGAIPGTTRKKKAVGLERGPLSLVSTTEELLDRKEVAPV
jgi:hypothetical protein